MRALAVAIVIAMGAATEAIAGDWPFYRHDLLGTSSAGEPLSAAQASSWSVKWIFKTHGANYSNPVVVGNTVYLSSGDGQTYAIDATTGVERWQQGTTISGPFLCIPPAEVTDKGPVGSPAVVGGDVYQPGGDGYLYDFAAADGAIKWKTKLADVTGQGDFLWTSAFPLHGKLYVGVASLMDCALVPGREIAVDAQTGAIVGTWWADATHHAGGGLWTQPVYDARTNRMFLTTGNVAADRTSAQQPWAQAIVAIDPDTMQTLDFFTTVVTDAESDNDFGASPVLFDTPAGAHLVAATNKNGTVYAWDRDHLAAGVKWRYAIGTEGAPDPDLGGCTISSPASANGKVFVGSGVTPGGRAGEVAALDPDTGAVLWKDDFDEYFLPAVTVTGDVVFAASTHEGKKADGTLYPGGGALYVLAQADGKVLAKLPTPVGEFGEPTWANGALFLPDLGLNFYAFVPGANADGGLGDGGFGDADGGNLQSGGDDGGVGQAPGGSSSTRACGCGSADPGGLVALGFVALGFVACRRVSGRARTRNRKYPRSAP